MSDFKESEKLPNDIETMLQLLLTHIVSASVYKRFDALPSLQALQVLLVNIAKQVDGTEKAGAASILLRRSEVTFIVALEESGIFTPPLVWPQMLNLRQRLQRLHVIRDTSFVLPIYTLFDTLTLLVFILLLGTQFATAIAGYLTTGVFTFLYVYMALLVRDLGACAVGASVAAGGRWARALPRVGGAPRERRGGGSRHLAPHLQPTPRLNLCPFCHDLHCAPPIPPAQTTPLGTPSATTRSPSAPLFSAPSPPWRRSAAQHRSTLAACLAPSQASWRMRFG